MLNQRQQHHQIKPVHISTQLLAGLQRRTSRFCLVSRALYRSQGFKDIAVFELRGQTKGQIPFAFENVRLMHIACKFGEVRAWHPDKQKVDVAGVKHVFLFSPHSVKFSAHFSLMSHSVTLVLNLRQQRVIWWHYLAFLERRWLAFISFHVFTDQNLIWTEIKTETMCFTNWIYFYSNGKVK